MPLDFRYHLASLTAVFVALIIGILLGVAMTDAPDLRTQIQDLRADFRRSQMLENVEKNTNQFNERTLMLLVKNRMFGRNVVLVQNAVTFPNDKIIAVREAFTQAGATITAEVTLKPALLLTNSEQVGRIYEQIQLAPPEKAGAGDLMRLLAADLGNGPSKVAPVLQKEKLIAIHGDITVPISTVVVLGGAVDTSAMSAKKIDVPFLQACAARKLRLAAVERLDTAQSVIQLYRKAAPITVDNIDRAAGLAALIFALSANQSGNYGYKSTADDVLPDID